MEKDNIKFMSPNSFLAKFKSHLEKGQEIYKQLEILLSEAPLTNVDQKADESYALLKSQGHFSYNDCIKIGIVNSSTKQRLFEALAKRHSDIKLTQQINRITGKKMKIATLKTATNELTKNNSLENQEELGFPLIREACFKNNGLTKTQIQKLINKPEHESQKLISKLVREGVLLLDSNAGVFNWIGN